MSLLYCRNGGSNRDNDIDFQVDKLCCDLGGAPRASLRPAILDPDGAILNPAEFTESPHKGSSQWTPNRSVHADEPDGRQLARLLCAHREQPRDCRATKHCDEIAPSHGRPAA